MKRTTILCAAVFALVLANAASAAVPARGGRGGRGARGGADGAPWGVAMEDRVYQLAAGCTEKDVFYYSEGVPCYARMFYPANYDPAKKTPAILLANGWTGVATVSHKYGAAFAGRGFVAMSIDYRGWGQSAGYATLKTVEPNIDPDITKRIHEIQATVVVKRQRLVPEDQVTDIRNAISYLQGEPGVDPDRIGMWGSSYAGGHCITVMGRDARIKVATAQVPSIAGRGRAAAPETFAGAKLQDAIKRSREGQGAETITGFSNDWGVDAETNYLSAAYAPFQYLPAIGERPVLFITATRDELIQNPSNGVAASKEIKNGKLIEMDTTHFGIYTKEDFVKSSTAEGDFFVEHLGATQ